MAINIRPLYAFRFCAHAFRYKIPALAPYIERDKKLWVMYQTLSEAWPDWMRRLPLSDDGYPESRGFEAKNILAKMPTRARGYEWLDQSLETLEHGAAWVGKDTIIRPITDEFIASMHRQFVARTVARGGRVELPPSDPRGWSPVTPPPSTMPPPRGWQTVTWSGGEAGWTILDRVSEAERLARVEADRMASNDLISDDVGDTDPDEGYP